MTFRPSMAGPVNLKHSCIMYKNMQVFWHVTLIKINYYYYYSQNWPNQRIPFPRISQLDQCKFKHFHKIIQLEWSKFICTFPLESDQYKFIKFHRVMQPDQYSFYIHLFTKIHPTGPVQVYNRTSTSLYISLELSDTLLGNPHWVYHQCNGFCSSTLYTQSIKLQHNL